jgi:hypothetical protein
MASHNRMVAVAAFLTLLTVGMSQAAEREAYLRGMIGTVKVRKGETPAWKDGRPNMVLREKDAVRTYVESQAEIMTPEGSFIKLDENSLLEIATLKDFGAGAQSTKVRILHGTILANVKKLINAGARFEFETPTAVASIRGTTVGFDVTGERTLIKVYDGEVLVTPKGSQGGVSIRTNQMATVKKGQKTVKAETLAEKPKGQIAPPAAPKADTANGPALIDTSSLKKAVDTAGRGTAPDSAAGTFRLSLVSPQDNVKVKPGGLITVAGRVSPASARVSVNGAAVTSSPAGDFKFGLAADKNPGDYDITVEAASGTQSQSMVRKYSVETPAELFLTVSMPSDGQVFGQPVIPVAGMTNPGADVSVGGIRCQVGQSGVFSGRIPIPDEETEITLDIEASYNGKSTVISRKIRYRSEIMLIITSPLNGQSFATASIPVEGQVLPTGAELYVADTKVQRNTNGKFKTTVPIPDQEGQVNLQFEVSYEGITKRESRNIVYRKPSEVKPADIIKPTISPVEMPQVAKTGVLTFTVMDRTTDDEVTFYRITDGMKESETGGPNATFSLPMEEGIHTYTVYAEDKAKNRSQQVTGTVSYLVRNFAIQMRRPIGTEIVSIPPSTPAGNFKPVYTVQFSILNVPDNDRRLIKQVTVTNLTTSQSVSQRDLIDLEMEFDIELKRGQNRLSVDVRDINDRIFSQRDLIVDVR